MENQSGEVAIHKYLKFEVSGMICAIPLARASSVMPMAELLRPPLMPSLLEGFLNLRGEAIAVVRLDRILRLEASEPTTDSHLLQIKTSAEIKREAFIFVVDRVHEVIALAAKQILSLGANHTFNHCVSAYAEIGQARIHLLSVDSLLLEREKRAVSEFSHSSQVRLKDLMREAG